MKATLLLSSLLFLATACSQPTTVAPPSPAASISTSTPAITNSIVGRWQLDGETTYFTEFTESGVWLTEGGGIAVPGHYERLSGDRLLIKPDSGTQSIYTYSFAGEKVKLTYPDGRSESYTRVK